MEKRGESVEVRGRSVEEAIEKGLAQLGLSRDEVQVEIISRGSRGVLGLGAEEARVRLTPLATVRTWPGGTTREDEGTVEPAPGREFGEVADLVGDLPDFEMDAEAPVEAPSAEVEQIAKTALENLLRFMHVPARVIPKRPSEFMLLGDNPPPVVLDVEGDDLGILIGRRAETLGALQYMVRLIVNHETHKWYNIVIDVEGYRERRESQLEKLAHRMAEQVLATQKPVVLEAMPPYERRIVHLALRNHPKVTTHSIGEGDNRKVMIHLRQ